MNLTTCMDYKKALIKYVQEKKIKNKSISFESMAKYCGIQKTYLSKVLHKKGNLSLDQFFLACQYLKLTSTEFEFMENLFHFSTTNIELRKIKYQKLLEENKKEILKSENNLKLTNTPQTKTNDLQNEIQNHQIYFLDPYYQLVHLFLHIPHYSKNPIEISKKLNLTTETLENYLTDLIHWNYIEKIKNSYRILTTNQHLSKNSKLNKVFRNFIRQASLNKMNQLNTDDFYSISVVMACSEESQQKIHKQFLEFLKSTQNEVLSSESNEVYQLNFDLLKWS